MCVSLCTIVCLCEVDEIISLLLCPARGTLAGLPRAPWMGLQGKIVCVPI